jgi:glycosyltransferase involved in cell wall biosynthesis
MIDAKFRCDRPTIALFVPTLGMGGAERQALTLARGLDKRRWRVLLIQASSEQAEYTCEIAGVLRITLGGGSLSKIIEELMLCLAANRVSILQAFLLSAQVSALAVRALYWNGQLIVSVRDALPVFRSGALPATIAGSIIYSCTWWVDHYIFNSAQGMLAKALLIPENKRITIYNGIDSDRFQPDPQCHFRLRSLIRASPTCRIVGILANLSTYKDYPNFIEAAQLVALQQPDVIFVSIGNDSLPGSETICRQVDQAGLSERIHFLGARTDVEQLAPGFDIGCLSSKTESFPNSLAEIMACEVPCVTTDVGDAAVIVAETGLIVPRENPRMLADALLLALAWSPAERVTRAKAARERIISCFSIDRMLHSHEKIFQQLLQVQHLE